MAETEEYTLEYLRKKLGTKGSFFDWLGMEILDKDDEWVICRSKWRPEMVQSTETGVTQGGVQAAIMDLTCEFAISARIGTPVPTIDLRVDYHRPAMKGDMICKGRVLKLGSTISTIEAYLYDEEENLLASCRGSFFTGAAKRRG